jgi:hypothetical protein
MKVFSLCVSLFFVLILNSSCTKEKLPKASEKGANTSGCKIEGKVFVPEQTITYPSMPPLTSYFNESNGSFELSVSEDSDDSNNGLQRYFHLDIKTLTIGVNKLNETSIAEISTSQLNKTESFTTTETIGGTLNITRLDTNANIISGTFSFQAAIRPTNTPGKIITVTNGRFDINYK